jgi:uncharacterized protein YjeT (DUF2065 family)
VALGLILIIGGLTLYLVGKGLQKLGDRMIEWGKRH